MREIKLKKIPLKILLDNLVELYQDGANYVDIIGIPNIRQDYLGILVKEEYFSLDEDDEIEEEPKNKKILLEDILKNLYE